MDARTSLWHGRRVLVTGCTGFLGTAVTRELLDRGAVVAGLTRDPGACAPFAREQATGQFWTVCGHAEDRGRLHSAMAVHEVSAVFHLAGDTATDTVLGAAGLYHPRIPVVVARPVGQLRLMSEDGPIVAPPLGIARFGELFGPGERTPARVVARTVAALLDGEAPAAADGRTNDFVYTRDAARACLLVAEAVGAGGESLDATFRTGWELTDQQMAKVVADVFAGRAPAGETEVPNNPLGWRPATSLAAAIAETIAWHRESGKNGAVGERAPALLKVA